MAALSPSDPEGILPHQESKRINHHLFPQPASVNDDDLHDVTATIPESTANNRDHQFTASADQVVTDNDRGNQPAERGSHDISQDGKRRGLGPRLEYDNYSGSIDTVGDEERHDLKANSDTSLVHNSSSTLANIEKQHRAIKQTDVPNEGSSRDLEKGETHSDNHDRGHPDGGNNRQTQWENDVVGWDGPDDPQNPHNWNKSKKYTVTVFYATLTFTITFASSVFSTATGVTAKMYGVSNEVMTLGTSLFVLVSASLPVSLVLH